MRQSRRVWGALAFGATLFSLPSQAANDTETEARIDELEELVLSLEERLGSRSIANVFDSVEFDIGGFLHATYTHIDSDSGSQGSFDRNNFELLIGTKLNERWTGFFANGFLRESDDPLVNANPDNDPTTDDSVLRDGGGTPEETADPVFNNRNKNPQIIAYVNYKHNDLFNVQIGRQITPHGIINIEHFPATLLEPEQPLFLRPFGENVLFPNFFTGIQFHGNRYFDDGSTLSYKVYTGMDNALSNTNITGARVGLALWDQRVEVGLNGHASEGRTESSAMDTDYDLMGVDVKVEMGAFQLKAEAYESDESTGQDRDAAYIQPAVYLNDQWTLFVRVDRFDKGGNDELTGTVSENTLGLNYTPFRNTRLRLNYAQRTYEDHPDDFEANLVQVSGTFSF